MSCGKPVIASDIGGIPETLNNGNCGNLFRPGDKDSLYCQLEELYSDERKRNELGRNARLFVENNFSINAIGISKTTP
mgnify:FL=1